MIRRTTKTCLRFRSIYANKVQHSIRKGLIRLSLHLYNTEEDVADVIALARTWRDTKAAA